MILTQEYLKIFLFTGIVATIASTIFLSSQQVTNMDFSAGVSAVIVDSYVIIQYTIYNTGDTDIVSVTADIQGINMASPVSFPLYPRTDTGYIFSSIKAIDLGVVPGDDAIITFVATDSQGMQKPLVKVVTIQ